MVGLKIKKLISSNQPAKISLIHVVVKTRCLTYAKPLNTAISAMITSDL